MRLVIFTILFLWSFVTPAQSENPAGGNCNYSGVYSTNWGKMTLRDSGGSIIGDYTHDKGKIEGSLNGNVLTGRWSEHPTYAGPTDAGRIEFIFGDDCASFTGKWAYDSRKSGWNGSWGGGKKIAELADLEAPAVQSVTAGHEGAAGDANIQRADTIEDLSAVMHDPVQEKYGLPNLSPELMEPGTGGVVPFATVSPGAVRGEVFIFRCGPGGGWRGPIRGNENLFSGDVVFTKEDGYAELVFGGASRMYLAPRTTLKLPSPQENRSALERGAIHLYENLKRFLRNEPFEVQGAHSIAGIKGTDFIVEVDEETGADIYTVSEGSIDVWLHNDPSTKREVKAGESVRVTKTGIEDNTYAWDALFKKYGWTKEK